MCRLIVGNGLNIAAGNMEMLPDKISERFYNKILAVFPVFNYLCGCQQEFTISELKKAANHNNEDSIEKVADNVIKLFIQLVEQYRSFTDTDMWIFTQFIKPIAIDAIFYKKNEFVITEIDTTIRLLRTLMTYSKVYTLNYYESWDDNRCVFLHGKYTPISYDKNKASILLMYDNLFSEREKKDAVIANTLSIIRKKYQVLSMEYKAVMELAFIGESFDKARSTCLYPSNTLYPSDMLPPSKCAPLYDNFDAKEDDELHIFGMSPYGDDRLIAKINKVKNVKIFVYEKQTNPETKQWYKKVAHADILDSECFCQ